MKSAIVCSMINSSHELDDRRMEHMKYPHYTYIYITILHNIPIKYHYKFHSIQLFFMDKSRFLKIPTATNRQ